MRILEALIDHGARAVENDLQSLVHQATGAEIHSARAMRKHSARQRNSETVHLCVDSRWAISFIGATNLEFVIEKHDRKPFDFFQQ